MHKKALRLPTDISILGKKYSWQIDVASLQSGSVGAGGEYPPAALLVFF